VEGFTIPRSFTFTDDVVWTFTIELWEFWTVIGSPLVFIVDNTLVDFTHVGIVITIEITVHVEFI